MNSLIYLRGINKPVVVSKNEAIKINSIWGDNSVSKDFVIHLGSVHFSKGEIKFIEESPDKNESDKWNEMVRKENRESFEQRKKFLALPATEKAKFLEMFCLLYKLSTGDNPSPEKKREAYLIQLRFFTEHKNRTLCDGHLLHTIIPDIHGRRINPFELGGFRIVENAILSDMRASRL